MGQSVTESIGRAAGLAAAGVGGPGAGGTGHSGGGSGEPEMWSMTLSILA